MQQTLTGLPSRVLSICGNAASEEGRFVGDQGEMGGFGSLGCRCQDKSDCRRSGSCDSSGVRLQVLEGFHVRKQGRGPWDMTTGQPISLGRDCFSSE